MTPISDPAQADLLATLRADAKALGTIAAFSPAPTNGDDIINGNGADDVIRALGGIDSVYGGGGRDRIFGDAGQDNLFGGRGRDKLFGGADQDVLNGNGGADRLEGGRQDDFLWGNAGRDSFVYRKSTGYEGDDTIQDFAIGTDRLLLIGFDDGLDGVELQSDGGGTAVLRLLETGTFILLQNVGFAQAEEALADMIAFA
jgi:Ca2+-binding RTX toxin-like protein